MRDPQASREKPMFEALTEELKQLKQELDPVTLGVPAQPGLLDRVNDFTARLKAALAQERGKVEEEIRALAAEARQKAEEIEQEEKKAEEAPPVRHPWEDHQGIDVKVGDDLAAMLLRAAKQQSGRERDDLPGRPSADARS